jgi:hypothetical protein
MIEVRINDRVFDKERNEWFFVEYEHDVNFIKWDYRYGRRRFIVDESHRIKLTIKSYETLKE